MTKLSSAKEGYIKKKKQALLKLSSFRENFERQKEERESDLEKAGKTWKEVSERFGWWQKQELPQKGV